MNSEIKTANQNIQTELIITYVVNRKLIGSWSRERAAKIKVHF